ncbi:methionine/alanine import family NSS transporter small subunit [Actinomycetaceae bacterium TAE3-ERU4]|nr:methionine/alanine import family NSS transporter small subunit [Actinomycetaceae bacterium TAE3-ERU4]
MTTEAIVMMVISISIIWGGLVYWTWSLRFKPVPPLSEDVELFISAVETEGEDVARQAAAEAKNMHRK